MNKEQIHAKINYYCLLAIVFTLPLFINLNSFLIIVLVANNILEGNYRQKIKLISSNRLAITFIFWFFLYAIGLLFTDNIEMGIFNLKKKLSFLALPVTLATIRFDGKMVKRIIYVFVASCFLAVIVCLSYAVFKYMETHSCMEFYYHNFSKIINLHAVYFSFYLCFISVFIFYELTNNEEEGRRKGKRLILSLLLFIFLFTIYLLASKLFFFVTTVIAFYFIINWFKRKKKLVRGIVYAVIFLAIITLFIRYSSFTRERFADVFKTEITVISEQKFDYNTPFTGISLRLVLAKLTLEAINQNNFWLTGAGTGDGQDELDKKIKEYNLYTGNKKLGDKGYLGYNTHCQYLESLLYTGLPGLVVLLYMAFISFRSAMKKKQKVYFIFLLIFFVFCFTESVLELHKGIIFFTFFNIIFYSATLLFEEPVKKPK